jgi:hypothetical protein
LVLEFVEEKADGMELLTLDLVLVEPGFRDVWSSRVLVSWEGREVPVELVDEDPSNEAD